MYLCLECSYVFEEPKEYRDVELEHFGAPCHEKWEGCPLCSGDFETVHRCAKCGSYITGEHVLVKDEERICENCYQVCNVGE